VLVIEALVGIVLLLFGRSLFWAFVALVRERVEPPPPARA